MATPQTKVLYTYDDYCQLPDDKRYELIDGELYEMAPAPSVFHQSVSGSLFFPFFAIVRGGGLGKVLYAPCDVILSEFNTVQPDLLFVAEERRHIITGRACEGPPDLVIEILSPSNPEHDLVTKRELYQRFGVKEYWQANPDARNIRVLDWVEGRYGERGLYGLEDRITTPLIPGLEIIVADIFLPT